MPWTDSSPTSRVFLQAVLNPLTASAWSTAEPTLYGGNGLSADVIKAALFDNTVSPDATAAVGSTGYNTGTWTTGKEVTHANWPAGGIALAGKTYASVTAGSQTTAGAIGFDATTDTAGTGTLTLANVYGCLVYDETITGGTVAKQGMCFNYFGGVQSVTGGTFTIVWDATGVFKFTN